MTRIALRQSIGKIPSGPFDTHAAPHSEDYAFVVVDIEVEKFTFVHLDARPERLDLRQFRDTRVSQDTIEIRLVHRLDWLVEEVRDTVAEDPEVPCVISCEGVKTVGGVLDAVKA